MVIFTDHVGVIDSYPCCPKVSIHCITLRAENPRTVTRLTEVEAAVSIANEELVYKNQSQAVQAIWGFSERVVHTARQLSSRPGRLTALGSLPHRHSRAR